VSTEPEQARLLAERIARRMSHGKGGDSVSLVHSRGTGRVADELAAMRATLAELQSRLARIESSVTVGDGEPAQTGSGVEGREDWDYQQQSKQASVGVRSPWLAGMYVPAAHSSQERFGVEEAAVSELVDFFEAEKKCELEPGGKPCDHCSMCSSRGF
jgi:hypothetical protein